MNNQNQNVTYQLYIGLRLMMIAIGIILFIVIGGQMFSQVDSRQAVVGQSRQTSK